MTSVYITTWEIVLRDMRQEVGKLTSPERRESEAKDRSYVPIHGTTKDALLQAEHRFVDKS